MQVTSAHPMHSAPSPLTPALPPGTQITLRLKASRSSMVRLSARAITGTTFTVWHSRFRNSMSRGRRLLRWGSDGSRSSSKCVSEGVPADHPCWGPLLLLCPPLAQPPHQCPVGGTKYTQQCTRVSEMWRLRVMRISSCRYRSYCSLI